MSSRRDICEKEIVWWGSMTQSLKNVMASHTGCQMDFLKHNVFKQLQALIDTCQDEHKLCDFALREHDRKEKQRFNTQDELCCASWKKE